MQLKTLLKEQNLEIKLPKTILEYQLFPKEAYTEHHKETTQEGTQIIVFTGTNVNEYKAEAILDPEQQSITEFIIHEDNTREPVSGIDKDGNLSIY